MKRNEQFDKIREWAEIRGLYDKGDVKTQYCKLGEEFGELGRAIIKSEEKELKDAIGDIVVVLTNLAHLAGTSIEQCIGLAFNEIENRKGSMQNGSFVKEEKKDIEVDVWRCDGLTEKITSSWAVFFTIGKNYKSFSEPRDGMLFLINDNNYEMVCDESQFTYLPF